MMSSLPLPVTFFSILLLLFTTACDDDANCIEGDYLTVRYIHNVQNAIFGKQAVVDRDSITFSTVEGEELPGNLSFVDSTMAIRILLQTSQNFYLLKLGSLRTDTFQVTNWLMPLGRDCPV